MNDNPGTIRERYEVDWNEDREIVDYVVSRWAAKDFYKGDLEKKWLKVIAHYEGFPYIDYDETRRILVDELQVPEWRVNLVVNLLLPKIRTVTAKHMRNRPIWDTLPATNETSSINRALKAKKCLQGFWYNAELDYDFITLLLWLGLTGNAFAGVSWDPNAGPEYTVSPRDFVDKNLVQQLSQMPLEDSRKQEYLLQDANQKFQEFVKKNKGANYPLGEVDVHIPTPFDLVFPYEHKFSKLPWLIVGQIREISYYADMGLDPKMFSPPTEKEARHLFYAKRLYNLFQLGIGTSYTSHTTREVLELQLWLPKSPQFRSGFHAVVAGGKVIAKGPNPYAHGSIPYVHFKTEESPGKVWGFSSAEMAVPILNEYQKTKSQITEIKNLMAKPKWVVPRTARISDVALTSEPGEVIEFSGAQAPVPLSPANIPMYMLRLPDMDRRDVDDIMAIHDASAGVNPSGSRSGLMNVNLQEQDDGQLAVAGLNIDKGLSKIGRFVLSTMDQFYREDRLLKIVGEKGRHEVVKISPGELSGPTDEIGIDYFQVRVTQFSQFGLSRAGQLEALKSLLQYNVFKPEDRDKIFKFLNIGFVEDDLDEFQVDRSNAYKENLQMSQGVPVPPDMSDEDSVHIQEHHSYMKGDEYRLLDPQIKSLFQKHVQDHKLYAATKAIEPQILMIPAQALAYALNGMNPGAMQNAGTGQGTEPGNSDGSKGNTQGPAS